MLELLLLLRVVCVVPRDVRKQVKANRSVDFDQHNSAVQVEAEQLPEHHVVLLRDEGADQLLAERTGCFIKLSAQLLLLHAGDFGLYCLNFRGEQIIIVTIVKLRWILQIYLEDKTTLFLVCNLMIK